MLRFLKIALYAIGWWVQEVLKICVVAAVIVCCATSGWHYDYHNGREMRCFCVHLPGFEEYTDWQDNRLQIVSRFSMRAKYRIGPWLEPEWTDTPNLPAEGAE